MTTLHSLQHSYHGHPWFDRCLASVKAGDGIILLEDAVSICCQLSSLQKLKMLDINLSCYVIDVDLQARGLTNQIDACWNIQFETVNYQEFVELTLQYDKLVNWA